MSSSSNSILRISATTVESFRKMFVEDYVTQQSFISDIKEGMQYNEKVELGTAFHTILETPETCKFYNKDNVEMYQANGFTYTGEDVKNAMSVIDYRFPFEVKQVNEFQTKYGVVDLVTKVDQLCGIYVVENKTKWSSFDYETYSQSLQHKFYNHCFDAVGTYYNVFEMIMPGVRNPLPRLKEIHSFLIPKSKNDIQTAISYLNKLVEFIYDFELESYFSTNLEKRKRA